MSDGNWLESRSNHSTTPWLHSDNLNCTQTLLAQNKLDWKEHKGTSPSVSIPKMLGYLRKRVKGEWGYAELGKNFQLKESNDMNIFYLGYAIKQ